MKITQVRVFPVEDEKLKAFVSVIFDDCFVVSDIKIIEGQQGLFISMPSKKRKNGTFRDIAHPLNNETRRRFEEEIIASYRDMMEESGDPLAPIRDLNEIEAHDASVPAPFAPPSRGPDSNVCSKRVSLMLLGRRQVVRHRVLVPTFGGSNPPAPATDVR